MTKNWGRIVALGLVLAATGCVPFGSMQTASTLGEGKTQLGVEPGVWGGVGSGGASMVVRPVDIAIRWGLSDSVDLGARIGAGGLELQGKFRFTEEGADTILSLAPALTGVFIGAGDSSASFLHLALPLLIGFGDPESAEIVLGPRVHMWSFFGGGGGASAGGFALAAGSSLGAAFKVTDSLKIMPELTVLYPFGGGASATDSDGDTVSSAGFGGASGVLYHLAVGFLVSL